MINFTGQTRRRNVNLGDKRQRGIGTVNYLEKSKLQRQQREEQRIKDKSSLVIQAYVKKYLDARSFADNNYDTWINMKVGNQDQFDEWIAGFNVMINWKFPFNDDDTNIVVLNRLNNYLIKWRLIPMTNRIIIKGLLTFINISKPSNHEIILKSGDLMQMVINKSPFKVDYPNLINTVTKVIDNNRSLFIDLIMSVNINDSYCTFLKFLSNIDTIDDKYLELLRDILCDSKIIHYINSFTKLEKISLLSIFLKIHGHQQFITKDYLSIGNILTTISFSVYVEDENTMEDDDSTNDSELSNDLKVSSSVVSDISNLYDNSFIGAMIDIFTNETHENSGLALNIISTLFHLLPEYKSRLCVSITIVPGSYKWFFQQLSKDKIYQKFIHALDEEHDYVKQEVVLKYYETLHQLDINNFWKTLYTFQELYSYWLIVSNDLESFNNDKLSLNEVTNFLRFLRVSCLTLIFISDSNKLNIYEEFDKLKEISITLLNQLYLKNLRLKFLPKGFWKIQQINFNIDSMLQIIGEEEERRIEEDEFFDEEKVFHKRSDKKSASIDTLAKLEILNKLPFFLKFNDRVQIFQSLIDLDRQRSDDMNPFSMFFSEPKLKADIRRDYLLRDAYNNFGNLGANFKKKIGVTFIDQWGQPEAGIDGGGITKEFLNSVVTEGFAPQGKYDLFKETTSNELYPNNEIYLKYINKIDVEQQMESLKYLKFLGSIIGKCLYESVLIDVSFAPFFLNKWCTSKNVMKNSINDLRSLDEELFSNLMKLTKMSNDELESLDLDFTINQTVDHNNYIIDLIKNNGSGLKVKSSNRLNYIHQIANFKLNTSLNIQSKYFLEGLTEIISSSWLKMFDFNELQMLISGSEYNIDLTDWKENVEYGGYLENELTIKYFWEIIEEMSPKERSKLLKFVTSVARPPLLGFGALNPKFGIRNSGSDIERLPTASTCVNLLKLPNYKDKEIIRNKLIYAINVDAGFDLS